MNINLKPNSPDLVVVPCYTREIEEVQNFLIDKNSIICIKPVEVEIAWRDINVELEQFEIYPWGGVPRAVYMGDGPVDNERSAIGGAVLLFNWLIEEIG